MKFRITWTIVALLVLILVFAVVEGNKTTTKPSSDQGLVIR